MIFFDANLSPAIVRLLATYGKDVCHVANVEGLGRAAPDDQWLKRCSVEGWHVVTCDRGAARRVLPGRLGALNINALLVPTSIERKGGWFIAQTVIRRWDDIEAALYAEPLGRMVVLKERGVLR